MRALSETVTDAQTATDGSPDSGILVDLTEAEILILYKKTNGNVDTALESYDQFAVAVGTYGLAES